MTKLETVLDKLIDRAAANPKTTLAGCGMIAAALLPKYSVQIGLILGGLGHILSQDAGTETKGN